MRRLTNLPGRAVGSGPGPFSSAFKPIGAFRTSATNPPLSMNHLCWSVVDSLLACGNPSAPFSPLSPYLYCVTYFPPTLCFSRRGFATFPWPFYLRLFYLFFFPSEVFFPLARHRRPLIRFADPFFIAANAAVNAENPCSSESISS